MLKNSSPNNYPRIHDGLFKQDATISFRTIPRTLSRQNKDSLPRLTKSGLSWVLLGVENSNASTLSYFKKGITPNKAKTAVKLCKATAFLLTPWSSYVATKKPHQSSSQLREFANDLDPNFIMFGILTPFHSTDIYRDAQQNGWIKNHKRVIRT